MKRRIIALSIVALSGLGLAFMDNALLYPVAAYREGNEPSYTVLLLHMDGTNNQTVFTDSSGSAKTLTTVGAGVKITTTGPFFGTGILTNNGTNAGMTLVQSADFDFGAGDFTIDFWIKPEGTQPANKGNLFCKAASVSAIGPLGLAVTNGTTQKLCLYMSSNGSTFNIINATFCGTLTSNAWTHVELSRYAATNLYCFTNGILSLSTTITNLSLYATSATTLIAFGNYVNSALMGYLDEYRVTKGLCRHTANFTTNKASYGE